MGRAIRSATNVTLSVPTRSGTSEYLGVVETGCQLNRDFPVAGSASLGLSMAGIVTSRWTSDDVRTGIASFATKTKMRASAAMTRNALDRMENSIARSHRRPRARRRSGSLPRSAKLAPLLDLAGINILELGDRNFTEGVGLVDEDRQPVEGNLELHGILPVLCLDLFLLLRFHRSRRLADVGFPVDQRLDPDSGAAAGDLNDGAGI